MQNRINTISGRLGAAIDQFQSIQREWNEQKNRDRTLAALKALNTNLDGTISMITSVKREFKNTVFKLVKDIKTLNANANFGQNANLASQVKLVSKMIGKTWTINSNKTFKYPPLVAMPAIIERLTAIKAQMNRNKKIENNGKRNQNKAAEIARLMTQSQNKINRISTNVGSA